jgi:hypothetical protein
VPDEPSESLTIGIGGWAEWRSPSFSGIVRLRFDLMPNGRFGVVETFITAEIVHTDALRAIPIGRIEALANTPLASMMLRGRIEEEMKVPNKIDELMEQMWSRIIPPPELIQHADGTYETLSGFKLRTPKEMRRFSDDLFSGPPITRLTAVADHSALGVTIPSVVRKPDSFYADIAKAYGAAASETSNPAKLIAELNDISVPKVYQWIKEARRRGLLTPATRNGRPTATSTSVKTPIT